MKHTIEQALKITQGLRYFLEPLNYCCGLTGSILFKGESDNDIDIIIYPLLTFKPIISDITLMEKLSLYLGATKYNRINYHKHDEKVVWFMELRTGLNLNFFILS